MEPSVTEIKPLSQVERVVDTFVAPGKTFTDLLRSTQWWLPFLLYAVVSAGFAFAIDKKIGFDAVAEQAIQQSPMAEERMDSLPPADRAVAVHRQAMVTKYVSYGSGIFFLIIPLVGALLNWATINFGFGAKTTFGQNYALQMYIALPLLIKSLLSIVLIYAGVGTENFDMKNPVGTNIGYYMPSDSAHWLKTLLTSLDLFSLWTLVLGVLGLAVISGKTKGQAAVVVVGWWLITIAVFTGLSAAFG
jgi:hypothetical protein